MYDAALFLTFLSIIKITICCLLLMCMIFSAFSLLIFCHIVHVGYITDFCFSIFAISTLLLQAQRHPNFRKLFNIFPTDYWYPQYKTYMLVCKLGLVQGGHFSGVYGNLEMSRNSAKVREK